MGNLPMADTETVHVPTTEAWPLKRESPGSFAGPPARARSEAQEGSPGSSPTSSRDCGCVRADPNLLLGRSNFDQALLHPGTTR